MFTHAASLVLFRVSTHTIHTLAALCVFQYLLIRHGVHAEDDSTEDSITELGHTPFPGRDHIATECLPLYDKLIWCGASHSHMELVKDYARANASRVVAQRVVLAAVHRAIRSLEKPSEAQEASQTWYQKLYKLFK